MIYQRNISDVRPFARDYLHETDIEKYNESKLSGKAEIQRKINNAKECLAKRGGDYELEEL